MKEEKKAVLITFSVKSRNFESIYERNKFFKNLYGWKQSITKKKKIYMYRREGILDDIPHIKVDQSSFIIPEDNFKEMVSFLREWHNKVMWKTFKVLLEDSMIRQMDEKLEEIEKRWREEAEEEV